MESVLAQAAAEGRAVGFVALSKFVVANGMTEEVRRAFNERPHLVDSAPGYVRMDVISPLDSPGCGLRNGGSPA